MKELTLDELCNLLDVALDDEDKIVSLTVSLDGIYCVLSPCDVVRDGDRVIIRLRDPEVVNDIGLCIREITYILDASKDEYAIFYVATSQDFAMEFSIMTF